MPHPPFDLAASARKEMSHEGFNPDWPEGTEQQVDALRRRGPPSTLDGTRDLRGLLWSSIDNDTSRDLDQIEVAERADSAIRVLIGIADVDSAVPIGSPIDVHAASQTTTVYTAVQTFPMLPEALSTDMTSLGEGCERRAIVIEMLIDQAGSITSAETYAAIVQNGAQLTYSAVGSWLEGSSSPPPKVAASGELAAQLNLQDEAASRLREQRYRLGALHFDRVEAEPVIVEGEVKNIQERKKKRASDLIEDFMIAANEVMAQALTRAGRSGIRRVVKSPERWPRIVDLAAQHGSFLPEQPDSAALAAFLRQQKDADPVDYTDLSLAIIKLMGPGEYVMARAVDTPQGHFGLAAHDYTHSTAPNRRFADLITQRLIKSVFAKGAPPYPDDELSAIAQNCTLKEDAARKVERTISKHLAALAFYNRRGEIFNAVVTGVTPKGVFVRVMHPPIEGRLMGREQGIDVGDRIRVTRLSTDPERGYLDFGR
jgi:exoribonuclease-2